VRKHTFIPGAVNAFLQSSIAESYKFEDIGMSLLDSIVETTFHLKGGFITSYTFYLEG
jgi:hypothetical protein